MEEEREILGMRSSGERRRGDNNIARAPDLRLYICSSDPKLGRENESVIFYSNK